MISAELNMISIPVVPDEEPKISLSMGSANERRCYCVTPSLIGWAHSQTDPWSAILISGIDHLMLFWSHKSGASITAF